MRFVFGPATVTRTARCSETVGWLSGQLEVEPRSRLAVAAVLEALADARTLRPLSGCSESESVTVVMIIMIFVIPGQVHLKHHNSGSNSDPLIYFQSEYVLLRAAKLP